FTQVNEAANAFGAGLSKLGVARGDRVGLLSCNRLEVVQAWFALEKHAMVRLAMHTHTDMQDHCDLLNSVGATAFVFDTRFADEVDKIREKLSSVHHFIAIGPACPAWATSFAQVVEQGSTAEPHIEV